MKQPIVKLGPLDSDYETQIHEEDIMKYRFGKDEVRTLVLFAAVAVVWLIIWMIS